jgi:hypothetical protein
MLSPRAGFGQPAASLYPDAASWMQIELQQSRAAAGSSWEAEFDQGGTWSAGSAASFSAGLRRRWRAGEWLAVWRGRVGEHEPATGRWLAARATLEWGALEMGAGRYPVLWSAAPGQKLLISEHAPPLDQIHLALQSPALPAVGGRGRAESFLAYLDDAHRTVAYPLLWGMRGYWEPAGWLHLEIQRTIMLGGAGRGERLTFADWVDIFLGQGENARGPTYPAADSDQKFAYLIELSPRDWARRTLGVDDLSLGWFYGGEDRFAGGVPMAPARTYRLRVAPVPEFEIEAEYANNADDRNLWYRHKLFSTGYTYRGFILGHPMGGDARRWRVRLTGAMARPGPAVDTLWLEALRQLQGVHRDGVAWWPVPAGELIRLEAGIGRVYRGREIRVCVGGQCLTGAYASSQNLYEGYARVSFLFTRGSSLGSRR